MKMENCGFAKRMNYGLLYSLINCMKGIIHDAGLPIYYIRREAS